MSARTAFAEQVLARFEGVRPDPSWSFAEVTPAQTRYATHGYHRYPAKFIPQLAARLIGEFSSVGGLVVDPFMGSGTTLVEAKLAGRASVGVDINPVACWITKAKVTPIEPRRLSRAVVALERALSSQMPLSLGFWREGEGESEGRGGQLEVWFSSEVWAELWRLHRVIEGVREEDVRDFFRCAFSHILKPCSWWQARSIKPVRDKKKRLPSPVEVFFRHVARMVRGNREFWEMLVARGAMGVPVGVYCGDARRLPLGEGEVDLIVTSPPYATALEYADLHQLTVLWYGVVTDWQEFRRQFIGTVACEGKRVEVRSEIGEGVVAALAERNKKKAREVGVYFTEMGECFGEMWRVLKRGGYACIVVGNRRLLGVEVLNAQVFVEQCLSLGFEVEAIIVREMKYRCLPMVTRDEQGRFVKGGERERSWEYVLVVRKK